MKSRLFNLLAAMSMLLFVIVVGGWILTRNNAVIATFQVAHRFIYVDAWGPAIRIAAVDAAVPADPKGVWFFSYGKGQWDPVTLQGPTALQSWHLGLAWNTESGQRAVVPGYAASTTGVLRPYRAIVLWWWFVLLVPALLPAAWLVTFALHRHAEQKRFLRISQGLCPNCGYDIRATPGQCPECGRSSGL